MECKQKGARRAMVYVLMEKISPERLPRDSQIDSQLVSHMQWWSAQQLLKWDISWEPADKRVVHAE